jgi:hypothetical protein
MQKIRGSAYIVIYCRSEWYSQPARPALAAQKTFIAAGPSVLFQHRLNARAYLDFLMEACAAPFAEHRKATRTHKIKFQLLIHIFDYSTQPAIYESTGPLESSILSAVWNRTYKNAAGLAAA